nr:MAG TPA: hypothetical protein [Caudoviricetes sp.]
MQDKRTSLPACPNLLRKILKAIANISIHERVIAPTPQYRASSVLDNAIVA